MKTLRYICGAATIPLALCFSWFAFAEEPGKEGSEIRFLFLQTAAGTSVKDGKLTLISPSTVYFSDRPARLAGHMSNESFVQAWSDDVDIQKEPPNAILQSFGSAGGQSVRAVVILKNPRIENANLVYDVQSLKGALPDQTPKAALFIDDIRLRGCRTGHQCSSFYQGSAASPGEVTPFIGEDAVRR